MSRNKKNKTTRQTNTCSLIDESVDLSIGSSFFDFFTKSLLTNGFKNRYFSFYGFKNVIYFYKSFGPSVLNPLKLIKIPKSSNKTRLVYLNSMYDRLFADRVLKSLPTVHSKFVYGLEDRPFYLISKKINSFYKSKKYFFVIGDFKNFSDSIPKIVLQKLIQNSELFNSKQKSDLKYFLNKSVFDGESLHTKLNGMHTGTAITNYLLNYFLLDFDNYLAKHSNYYMRVGDDFVCVFKQNNSSKQVTDFINSFQKSKNLEINVDVFRDNFEFLAYRYSNGKIKVRDSSVKKFLANVSSKLQVLDADLDSKICSLDAIYKKRNGLLDLQKKFLLDYRFVNCNEQIKLISREIKRYQNRFLFGYLGFKNSSELNLLLNSLKIKSFQKLYYENKINKK